MTFSAFGCYDCACVGLFGLSKLNKYWLKTEHSIERRAWATLPRTRLLLTSAHWLFGTTVWGYGDRIYGALFLREESVQKISEERATVQKLFNPTSNHEGRGNTQVVHEDPSDRRFS
jgi:hypothetical protein